MLLYPVLAVVTPFPRTFIINGNANNERIPLSCSSPAFMTLFPDMDIINEKAIVCINEEAKSSINEEVATDAIRAPTNSLFNFFT